MLDWFRIGRRRGSPPAQSTVAVWGVNDGSREAWASAHWPRHRNVYAPDCCVYSSLAWKDGYVWACL